MAVSTRPAIRATVSPRLPALLLGKDGVAVTREGGGAFSVRSDFTNLEQANDDELAKGATTIAYIPEIGEYREFPTAEQVQSFSTVEAAESAVVSNATKVVQVVRRNTDQALGGASRFARVPNSDPDLPTQINILGKRWENVEEQIGDDWFANINDAFTVTKAKLLLKKSRTFDTPISSIANMRVETATGAVLRPTFKPVGAARNTPMMTLGSGFQSNRVDVALDAGIDTIKTLVQVGDDADIGVFRAISSGLNNNRTASGSTDVLSGALLINGRRIRIGAVISSRFDRALTIATSRDVVIQGVSNFETVLGVYVQDSSDIHILKGYSSGPTDPSEPNAFSRGIMTPGANSLCLAGCARSSFSNWYSENILEHAVRVGAVAAGTTVLNENIAFNNVRSIAPYGCGFKMDDGDAEQINRIIINGLYTEDVGHGMWFGTGGHVNWSGAGGTNDPSKNSDGNKIGCAIRNTTYATVTGFMNRAQFQAQSGFYGFWTERASDVNANVDTMNSRSHGIVVQGGRPSGTNRVTVYGSSRDNGGDGFAIIVPSNSDTFRGISLRGDSSGNTGYGVSVQVRPNGGSPYATTTSIIDIRGRGNTAGNYSAPLAAVADPDTQLENFQVAFTPTITFATTQGDFTLSANTSIATFRQIGDEGVFEMRLNFTPSYTVAPTGNIQFGGLPLPCASQDNVVNVNGLTSFAWNSRTMLIGQVIQGTNYVLLRAYGSSQSGSPLSVASFPSGTPVQISLIGRYRIL